MGIFTTDNTNPFMNAYQLEEERYRQMQNMYGAQHQAQMSPWEQEKLKRDLEAQYGEIMKKTPPPPPPKPKKDTRSTMLLLIEEA